jgi:hypothetical protein
MRERRKVVGVLEGDECPVSPHGACGSDNEQPAKEKGSLEIRMDTGRSLRRSLRCPDLILADRARSALLPEGPDRNDRPFRVCRLTTSLVRGTRTMGRCWIGRSTNRGYRLRQDQPRGKRAQARYRVFEGDTGKVEIRLSAAPVAPSGR